jgi:hypothetical protein
MEFFTLAARRAVLATAAAATLVGSALVAGPSSATPASPDRGPAITAGTVQALFDATDEEAHRFDGELARRSGVDPATVDSYATGFAATDGTVENVRVDERQVTELRAAVAAVRACAGRTRYDYTGLQLNVYLNSCKTNALLYVIGGGVTVIGSITAIIGATGLPAAATAGLAALLAVAGTFLGVCSSKGRGTVIHNVPPSTITWCNSQ